jgi:hypothetical protein
LNYPHVHLTFKFQASPFQTQWLKIMVLVKSEDARRYKLQKVLKQTYLLERRKQYPCPSVNTYTEQKQGALRTLRNSAHRWQQQDQKVGLPLPH